MALPYVGGPFTNEEQIKAGSIVTYLIPSLHMPALF